VSTEMLASIYLLIDLQEKTRFGDKKKMFHSLIELKVQTSLVKLQYMELVVVFTSLKMIKTNNNLNLIDLHILNKQLIERASALILEDLIQTLEKVVDMLHLQSILRSQREAEEILK
jgi:hypothetical protein